METGRSIHLKGWPQFPLLLRCAAWRLGTRRGARRAAVAFSESIQRGLGARWVRPAPEAPGTRGHPRQDGAARHGWGSSEPGAGPLAHKLAAPARGDFPPPQDARGQQLLPGPHAMDKEAAAAGAPHCQPDLPARAAAPDRGRHPAGHGKREAGGRAGFHVSEPAHRQGEPLPAARPCSGRLRYQWPAPGPKGEAYSALVRTHGSPARPRGGVASLSLFPHPQSGRECAHYRER